MSSAGVSTAAIGFGGFNPGQQGEAKTESWNGTNWTEVNDLNVGRNDMGGCGTQTDALGFGGVTPAGQFANTEEWSGTSWTETSNLSTARNDMANVLGASALGLCAGGGPSTTAATEEWSRSSILNNVLTD